MADPNQELHDSLTNLNNRMAQFATSLTALQNAVSNMAAGPPAAVFSTTPGTTRADQPHNFGSRWGLAVYEEQGTKSLYDKDEEKFDLDNNKVTSFVSAVKDRAVKMGWTSATQGVTTYTVNGSQINVIEDYGRIGTADLRTQSEPFYLATGARRSQQRAAQNNAMWAEMLKASLTPKAQEQVVIYKDEYEVQTAAGGQKIVWHLHTTK
jgi:hypothetical protein